MGDTIGKRITELRRESGMTQEQLAEKMGVSPQAVSKWENDVSCPDISALPLLSEVFGVTTDYLLGVNAPQEEEPEDEQEQAKYCEAEIVGGQDGEEKKKNVKGNFEWHWDARPRKGGIIFALSLIVIGVALFLTNSGLGFITQGVSLWSVVWPSVIMALGISSFIKELSPFSLGCALLGLYYLLYNLGAVSWKLDWGRFWPVVLVLIGLSVLTDHLFRKRRIMRVRHNEVSELSDEDGFINVDCSFSQVNAKTEGAVLRGGKADISFGRCVIDYSSCTEVQPGARLDIDLSFGGATVVLPRCVKTAINVDHSFGSHSLHGEPDETAAGVLLINGDISFGNLDIKYI